MDPSPWRLGGLFTGLGVMELALQIAGVAELSWISEIDPYCSKLHAAPNLGDIRGLHPPPAEVLCGGPPCQPVSVAGVGQREADPRWLWPDFFRIVQELRPHVVVIENTPGILSTAVPFELAELGYAVAWTTLSAGNFELPHRRRRVYMVGLEGGLASHLNVRAFARDLADPGSSRCEVDRLHQRVFADAGSALLLPVPRPSDSAAVWGDWLERGGPAPCVHRGSHGAAAEVLDYQARVGALGNSIVLPAALHVAVTLKRWIG